MDKTEIATLAFFVVCCGGWALGELIVRHDSTPALIVVVGLLAWRLIGMLKEAAKDSRKID